MPVRAHETEMLDERGADGKVERAFGAVANGPPRRHVDEAALVGIVREKRGIEAVAGNAGVGTLGAGVEEQPVIGKARRGLLRHEGGIVHAGRRRGAAEAERQENDGKEPFLTHP